MPTGVYIRTEEHKKKYRGRVSTFLGKHHTEESKEKLRVANLGKFLSEETKKKMSEARKGENNPNFGKHHSEESKEKLRKANLGKSLSEETKRKISESLLGHPISEKLKERMRGNSWNKGRHPSEETRRKIGEARLGKHPTEETREKLRGRIYTEETKRKMSLANLGRPSLFKGIPLTEETKRKISKAKLGHSVSEEARRKMSLANKGRFPGNKGIIGKYHHTEETKRKISESLRGRPHFYVNKPYKVFYNNTWFRSGWEAKYAEWLDDNNIKWEYEVHTFLLEIDGKPTTYRPDFYLPEFEIYHEVKGYTRPGYNNIKKVQPVREQYGISLTVIDKVWLKRIGVL